MNARTNANYPATPHSFALRIDEDISLRLRERHLAPELTRRIDEQREHLGSVFPWVAESSQASVDAFITAGLERFSRGEGWEADLCWRGDSVGAVGLRNISPSGGSAEFGFWLNEEQQGRGLVSRTCRRLVSLLFEHHQVGKVVVAADPENTRSIAVAERLGMRREAVLRRSHLGGAGRLVDMAFYGLLRPAWEAAREQFAAPVGHRFSLRVDDELELTLLERADVAELSSVVDRNEDHLMRWLPWAADSRPASQQGFVDYVAMPALVAASGLHCAIRRAGRLVGTVALHGADHVTRRGHLGYWLAADEQGRGVMTRSVKALVARCFALPLVGGAPFERLEIRAAVDNLPSRAVAERLGFVFEGVLHAEESVHGRWVDHAVYGLLRDDWNDAPGLR